MLRVAIIGIAMSVLAAACSLIEPPVPPGTYPMEAEVRNNVQRPVVFNVARAMGGALPAGQVISGAVQPPSVPAGPSTTKVIFWLPSDSNWVITIPEWGEIEGKDFDGFLAQQCGPLVIEIGRDGAWGWGCGP